MLQGNEGQAMALAMQTLVKVGKAFGAERLVAIKSAHLAGSFGSSRFKAYLHILDQFVAEGIRVRVPTTVNPRPGRTLGLLNRIVFSRQPWLERQLAQLGVTPNYSCICYDDVNIPALGDRLCWSESSAVQFANSALGARCNRNSVLVDICSAVTGYTPEFGYLMDENRRGQVLVKLQLDRMDPSALGYVLGRRLVNRVPVVEHYDFSRAELKNMGAAMAATGAVSLFHVEGLTPEAPDLQTVFDGEPQDVITIHQADLDSMHESQPQDYDAVVFGCPHLFYEEVIELAEQFAGCRVTKPTYLCTSPAILQRLQAEGMSNVLHQAGVNVVDFCPVAAFTPKRRSRVLTASGKCHCYLHNSEFGMMEACLRVCGART